MFYFAATLLSALALLGPRGASAINCKGCTPLDTLTFDKMASAFPFSLIKFDTAYPYGDKHEEFAKVAADAADLPKLFVGEVGIKDYGEKDNEELGERFGVTKDDYPAVILLKKVGSKLEEHRFSPASDDEFTSESLKNFVRQHTGIYMPLPGCLEAFDVLADKVTKMGAEPDKKKLEAVRDEMAAAAAKLDDDKAKARADNYVKIMRKVAADGIGFVKKETERTKKLLDTKLTEKKKKELQDKLNVLRSFTSQEEIEKSKKEEKAKEKKNEDKEEL